MRRSNLTVRAMWPICLDVFTRTSRFKVETATVENLISTGIVKSISGFGIGIPYCFR